MVVLSVSPQTALPSRSRESERAGRWTVRSAGCLEGSKLLHFVRHAQGFHNIDSRPIALRESDARLTPQGEQQCAELASELAGLQPELIVASPLTRTLQTATLVFGRQLAQSTPLLACEHARETVNYLCDCRRPMSEIMKEFPHCDWGSSCLADADEDSLWASYESIYGGAAEYTGLRESKDTSTIAARSALFFEWLAARPEREIAIVSHAAFLRTTMSFGTHRQDFASLGIEPLVEFKHPEDDKLLSKAMGLTFANAECRSLIATFSTS